MAIRTANRISGSLYSVHPAYERETSSLRLLKDRTGKDLTEWVEIGNRYGPENERELEQWFKTEHGHSPNYASWLASHVTGNGGVENYRPDELVDKMFDGKKAPLRPIYEEILRFGLALGDDVMVCPCATIVPFFRTVVFAQLKPTTLTRIDLGFALDKEPFTDRLLDTGGLAKKDRITHRIPISTIEEFDEEAKTWFRLAYERGR